MGIEKSHHDLKAEIRRRRVIKEEFLPMLRWISILGGLLLMTARRRAYIGTRKRWESTIPA